MLVLRSRVGIRTVPGVGINCCRDGVDILVLEYRTLTWCWYTVCYCTESGVCVCVNPVRRASPRVLPANSSEVLEVFKTLSVPVLYSFFFYYSRQIDAKKILFNHHKKNGGPLWIILPLSTLLLAMVYINECKAISICHKICRWHSRGYVIDDYCTYLLVTFLPKAVELWYNDCTAPLYHSLLIVVHLFSLFLSLWSAAEIVYHYSKMCIIFLSSTVL